MIALVLTFALATDDARPEPAWWSLQRISRPELPRLQDTARLRTPVDYFVQAKLEPLGLKMGAEADRRTLIRRLKIDLHGLPPTPQELAEFESDPSPDAYDRLVDRLLDSPRYGERWARHWLDVVRFAESKGYERDRIRENAWRYRDWVIRALNDDKPYAEFIREQLAGDALRPNDPDAAVPTGFLVTGPNNDVGNQSQLELLRERADELDEIVQNVSSTFLGLTVACARCHDHKFDPIPTADYYRFAAVFSGVRFGDRILAPPAESSALAAQLAAWDSRVKEINQQLTAARQELLSLGALGLNALKNEVRFDPVEARFIRLTITATVDGAEPCIDELEIYGEGPDGSDAARNHALGAYGASATASSLLPGFAIHQIGHLNDGQVGNSHSWISNEKGSGWAQIELAEVQKISRVVWGRDRDGKYMDRVASEFRLEHSMDGRAFSAVAPRKTPIELESSRKIAELEQNRARLQKEKESIEKERSAVEKMPKTWAALSSATVPVKVLKRGDVQLPGEEAPPAALSAVTWPSRASPAPLSDESEPAQRLKLAEWIADSQNPLTWRVMANRVWHYHFGVGLVTTPSDFGAAGSNPSHPELLDWLADEFRRSGGRLKSLHRTIVRSAAYRQVGQPSQSVVDRASAIDPDNRLLWRFNRTRLDAETLRDSILAISGSLDLRGGGASYRPFQYIEGNIPVYEPAPETPLMWRRTVYRHIVRTHRQPFLDTFDCPDPSVMTATRTQTTTPLQALSLLNNPFVVEQANRFAEMAVQVVGAEVADQVRFAVRQVLLRDADSLELEQFCVFVRQHGLGVFCRALLNTNEFLYVD